jgi:hypothetical protein
MRCHCVTICNLLYLLHECCCLLLTCNFPLCKRRSCSVVHWWHCVLPFGLYSCCKMLTWGPWIYFNDARFLTDVRHMCFLCIYGCHNVFPKDSVPVHMTARVRLHRAPGSVEATIAFTKQSSICLYLIHISYALCFRLFRTQSCIYKVWHFVTTCQLYKLTPK